MAELRIKILNGPNRDTLIPLKEGLTIGRKKADILLEDAKASSLHAKISKGRNGVHNIVDQNSSNGVKVAGERQNVIPLIRGARFQIGSTLFEVIDLSISENTKLTAAKNQNTTKKVPNHRAATRAQGSVALPPDDLYEIRLDDSADDELLIENSQQSTASAKKPKQRNPRVPVTEIKLQEGQLDDNFEFCDNQKTSLVNPNTSFVNKNQNELDDVELELSTASIAAASESLVSDKTHPVFETHPLPPDIQNSHRKKNDFNKKDSSDQIDLNLNQETFSPIEIVAHSEPESLGGPNSVDNSANTGPVDDDSCIIPKNTDVKRLSKLHWKSVLSQKSRQVEHLVEEPIKQPISGFSPGIRLNFIRGPQAPQSVDLGYGPRTIGRESTDVPVFEKDAPPICFTLFPHKNGAMFVTDFPEVVQLNGLATKSEILNDGDVINILGTAIEIETF